MFISFGAGLILSSYTQLPGILNNILYILEIPYALFAISLEYSNNSYILRSSIIIEIVFILIYIILNKYRKSSNSSQLK